MRRLKRIIDSIGPSGLQNDNLTFLSSLVCSQPIFLLPTVYFLLPTTPARFRRSSSVRSF